MMIGRCLMESEDIIIFLSLVVNTFGYHKDLKHTNVSRYHLQYYTSYPK